MSTSFAMLGNVSFRSFFRQLTEEGVFGDCYFVNIFFDDDSDKMPQFMSTVHFAKVCVERSEFVGEIPVIVKVLSEGGSRPLASRDLFANEATMYRDVIPLLWPNHRQLFPLCYYGQFEGSVKNDVIVLEDLRKEGFVASNSKLFLDLPHLVLSLKKLGEFHGMSYKLKRENRCVYNKLGNKLLQTKFSKGWCKMRSSIVIDAIVKNSDIFEGNESTELLKIFSEGLYPAFSSLTEAEEPFAVICHGDFNRNNLLFKYSRGSPTEVKFIDLQNSVYGDPTLDLSFILYMNTTAETRLSHWDSLLDAYWSGLDETVLRLGFSRQEFFRNFAAKAFVGFVEVAPFLPAMMGNIDPVDVRDFVNWSDEEKARRWNELGGLKAKEAVRQVLKHMVDKDYLNAFLSYHKNTEICKN